jgi:SagB-type dehydrogenase family enzyme
MRKLFFALLTVCSATLLTAQSTIKLPVPDKKGGKSLMWCLNNRVSLRSFSSKKLTDQQLSNLLWAAFGVNRSDGKRTAPSARNWQEIMIYAAMEQGLYLYDAKKHELTRVFEKDMRPEIGGQAFHVKAPVDLIFVADLDKMNCKPEEKSFYAGADTGFISQNVYLFCASEGMSTVVCGYIDRNKLSKAMQLPDSKKIIFAQPVGFPE